MARVRDGHLQLGGGGMPGRGAMVGEETHTCSWDGGPGATCRRGVDDPEALGLEVGEVALGWELCPRCWWGTWRLESVKMFLELDIKFFQYK